jgi:large subunit ribosomal protein L4
LFRGGARAFGPHPRDYYFKLNKKLKKVARKSALSYKAQANGIFVIEDFTFEIPKTKNVVEMINNFEGSRDKKIIFVVPESNPELHLSSRNLQNAKVVLADSLNTYDILNAHNLFFFESSFKFEQVLA